MVKVEFKKLYENSRLPARAHETDAGFDLYAHSFVDCAKLMPIDGDQICLLPGRRVLVKTGFSMALPPGYEAQVRPRSGLALKHGITVVNSPGTIDAGFRGEVGVILLNTDSNYDNPIYIGTGDRIAQMVIQKLPEVVLVEVEELGSTDRTGGFGSTGG